MVDSVWVYCCFVLVWIWLKFWLFVLLLRLVMVLFLFIDEIVMLIISGVLSLLKLKVLISWWFLICGCWVGLV